MGAGKFSRVSRFFFDPVPLEPSRSRTAQHSVKMSSFFGKKREPHNTVEMSSFFEKERTAQPPSKTGSFFGKERTSRHCQDKFFLWKRENCPALSKLFIDCLRTTDQGSTYPTHTDWFFL
jgi:hypothetical protein